MSGMRLLVAGAMIVSLIGPTFAAETTKTSTENKKQDEFHALPAGNLGGLAVRLQPDGTLLGTIGYIDPNQLELIPIPGFEYRFVQNRQTIARGVSGQDGRVVVRGLSPLAVYSLVGRGVHEGQRWMVACGISIFPPEIANPGVNASASTGKRPRTRLATAKRRYFSALEQFAQTELACGCCPEGDVGGFGRSAGFLDSGLLGGAGGGGGGGAGGIGSLAAFAALAALAANGNQQAASPFRIGN